MGDVLVAGFGVADVAGDESLDSFLTVLEVVHVDHTVEDDEDLGAVVSVPNVRLVCPVRPYRGVVDLGDLESAPGRSAVMALASTKRIRGRL